MRSKSRFNTKAFTVNRGHQQPDRGELGESAAAHMSTDVPSGTWGPAARLSRAHLKAGLRGKAPMDPLAEQMKSHLTPSGKLRRRD
jgi:hypothetical protein